jgi:hypothetical protein
VKVIIKLPPKGSIFKNVRDVTVKGTNPLAQSTWLLPVEEQRWKYTLLTSQVVSDTAAHRDVPSEPFVPLQWFDNI